MIDGQLIQTYQRLDDTLDAVYTLLEVGVEKIDFAAGREIEALKGFDPRPSLKVLMDLGILERRGPEYGNPSNGMVHGRHYHYTLMVPRAIAETAIETYKEDRDKEIAASRAGAGAKASRTKLSKRAQKAQAVAVTGGVAVDETVAVVGPDAPEGLAAHVPAEVITKVRSLRTRDEAAALVEAARQYIRRTDTLAGQIDSLEKTAKDLGVQFDRDAILASFTLERDERLEIVADLLPYIDGLEGKSTTLKQQIEDLREKGRLYDQLVIDHRRLKELHNQTIAGKVAQGQPVTSAH